LYIGEATWAFIFGIIIGPHCANIFNPHSWGSHANTDIITLEFTRVVLAIGVFAIGVELPKAYMRKHWKSLFYLLVPVMSWGWFVSAALVYALIPKLNFISSLAVAACLTPTDPILAAAVVGGKWADKHVPAHIRHLLAAESGCNDGAAFPFLFIALYLMIDKPNVGIAVRDWFLYLWLYQVVLGTIIGATVGFSFRHLMKFCQKHNLIDRHSYVAQYISLAVLTIGVCTLIGSDDLLAAFACGTAFAWDGFFNRQTEESVFSSVIDLLFNIAAFVYIGAWMPFDEFSNVKTSLEVWRLFVLAVLILLLRRLPIVVLLYRWIPDIKTFREAVFSGHFGPIGVGAVFISTLAVQVLHHAGAESDEIHMVEETIQPIVAFMVLCSIAVHGLSISGFSLGRRVHSVSRTWSRRDTATSHAQPDWTNHARMISRGDEIVINRDHDAPPLPGSDSDIEKAEWVEGKERVVERPDGEGDVQVDVSSSVPASASGSASTSIVGDAEGEAEWEEMELGESPVQVPPQSHPHSRSAVRKPHKPRMFVAHSGPGKPRRKSVSDGVSGGAGALRSTIGATEPIYPPIIATGPKRGRLENLKAMSGPPTRDSSPSRSVRFVQPSGPGGANGSVVGRDGGVAKEASDGITPSSSTAS